VGALPAGEVGDRLDLAAVGLDGVGGAEPLDEFERGR
jgi:hypothetical protein